MLLVIHEFMDVKVTIASLAGAMVYIMTQHHFKKKRRNVMFFVSFFIGVIGADTTINLFNDFIPSAAIGERALGAFLCSALVVTVIIKTISYINDKFSTNER